MLNYTGVRELQRAICLCAVEDYRLGLKRLQKNPNYKPTKDFYTAKKFMESPMFKGLCGINGSVAIESIRKQVAEGKHYVSEL